MKNITKKFVIRCALILLLIVIGAFFRFYNLNWGAPYYFHPDERNIASSVTQLRFPDQMNPHFFAYGSLPIYAIYFTGLLTNFISNYSLSLTNYVLSFEHAIIISRFFSAFFSIGIIPLTYFVGKQIAERRAGFFAAILATFSIGLIQSAHFGTVEIAITFFSLFLFSICITLLTRSGTLKKTAMASLVFGILIATKITSLVFLPLPILAIFFSIYLRKHTSWYRRLLLFTSSLVVFLLFTSSIYLATNPFAYLSFSEFRNSMSYESDVALGKLPVFYTAEFFGKAPVFFQFTKIYPFLLNPLITIAFVPAFLYILCMAIKTKNLYHLLLIIYYLLLFLPNAFLFAKWTRYMVPTLPFIYLMIGVALTDFFSFLTKIKPFYSSSEAESRVEKSTSNKFSTSLRSARTIFPVIITMKYLLFCVVIMPSILFALAYFITAFVQEDSRIAAAHWGKQHMSKDSKIISEVYDLGITPFNDSFHYSNITLFNFYDLDNNSPDATEEKLSRLLEQSQYIILPSQRILKTRLQNLYRFQNGYGFYHKLLTGKLGYKKIYETPCDVWCRIAYLNDPMFHEITVNVFDRPIVMIFKRQ